MKLPNKIFAFASALVIGALAYSCSYDIKDLEPRPVASFTVTPITGQVNKYLLTSTSTNAFRFDWDKGLGGGLVQGKQIDTAYFPDKGTYTVSLLAYGQSGLDSAKQTVTVAADDPAAVTPLKLLTGKSTKTWILDQPGGGALWVGPNDVGAGAWWSNAAGDVTAADRTCLFNDEYTFKMDGTFIFDAKGDMRVDDEGGAAWPTDIGLAIGCYSMTQIPTKYQPWGSGNFTFQINGNQLKVIGTGAHLGLYKVGETQTTPMPDPAVTYEIMSISETKLVVKKQYVWGQWRFTFKPKP
jgi:PKD repeat protein